MGTSTPAMFTVGCCSMGRRVDGVWCSLLGSLAQPLFHNLRAIYSLYYSLLAGVRGQSRTRDLIELVVRH